MIAAEGSGIDLCYFTLYLLSIELWHIRCGSATSACLHHHTVGAPSFASRKFLSLTGLVVDAKGG